MPAEDWIALAEKWDKITSKRRRNGGDDYYGMKLVKIT